MSAAETGETGLKRINQEYRHYDKKMAHFLFDFRVIPWVLATEQMMSVINKLRRLNSVDISCGKTTVALR